MRKDQDQQIKIKIIMVGDSGVGKTNIRERFCQNKFDPFSNKTIGIQFSTRKFHCPFEQKLHRFITYFWDVVGQLNNPQLSASYFKNIVGVIYVFDLTNLQSMKSLKKWQQKISQYNNDKVISLLLGNKKDLIFLREVQQREIQTFKSYMAIQNYQQVAASEQNGGIQDAIQSYLNKITSEFELGLNKPTRLRKLQMTHYSCI